MYLLCLYHYASLIKVTEQRFFERSGNDYTLSQRHIQEEKNTFVLNVSIS